MNYYLFADNFRGFSSACIPVADVNFLVGENSTGKSSILSLIRLLSEPALWMGPGGLGPGLGGYSHFDDIVSANANDKSFFRIGFASDSISPKRSGNGNMTTGSLLTFREKQGQPFLYKCTVHRNRTEVSLKFGRGAVSYRSSSAKEPKSASTLLSTICNVWCEEHRSDANEGYKKLDIPSNFPLAFALALASSPREKDQGGDAAIDIEQGFGFTPPQLAWFAPIRSRPKRTYDELSIGFSSEGRHTPYLIRRMLRSKKHATKLRQFIDAVGESSGLFQDVKVKNFGGGTNARFELDIVLDGKALNILNVGYGVSQALPIIVEMLARGKGQWFAIQEPEIHLHPRAQAAFGDILFDMAVIDKKRFLVETHSDFTIDRFRMRYRTGTQQKPESQVLFFERSNGHNTVTALPISKSGELPEEQPEKYRQFFIREQMSVLGI